MATKQQQVSSHHLLHLHTRLGVTLMAKSKLKKSTERNSLEVLYRKRDKALDRLIAAWQKCEATGGDEYDLNAEIDALAIAQVAAVFARYN